MSSCHPSQIMRCKRLVDEVQETQDHDVPRFLRARDAEGPLGTIESKLFKNDNDAIR